MKTTWFIHQFKNHGSENDSICFEYGGRELPGIIIQQEGIAVCIVGFFCHERPHAWYYLWERGFTLCLASQRRVKS